MSSLILASAPVSDTREDSEHTRDFGNDLLDVGRLELGKMLDRVAVPAKKWAVRERVVEASHGRDVLRGGLGDGVGEDRGGESIARRGEEAVQVQELEE